MKTFHVNIVYSTPNGPIVKTHTLKASTPSELDYQVKFFAEYDCRIGEQWLSIEITQIKESVELVLAS